MGRQKRVRLRRPSPKEIATFLYVWLMVGFASGTFVLLVPARWVAELAATRSLPADTEKLVMMAMIAVYVLTSFVVALALTRLLFQQRARAFKYGLVLGITALAGIALWGWSNPAVYASIGGGGDSAETMATASGAVFSFGPYPSRERLVQLKAEGITAVVSLQHPAVVPFEPEGIAKGRAWAEELGIRFVHAPMLPWVSDNTESLETIRRLTTETTGRFYVHCGLGRDRVNVVKRMLEQMGATTGTSEVAAAMGWEERVAEGLTSMERGEPHRIATDVWLVPRPNEHELFGNMLAGQAGLIVLLLDPEDPEQGPAVVQAIELFEQFGVEYLRRPLQPGDQIGAQRIAEGILRGPRPVTIVVPTTAPHDGTEVAELFLEAWAAVAGPVAPRSL